MIYFKNTLRFSLRFTFSFILQTIRINGARFLKTAWDYMLNTCVHWVFNQLSLNGVALNLSHLSISRSEAIASYVMNVLKYSMCFGQGCDCRMPGCIILHTYVKLKMLNSMIQILYRFISLCLKEQQWNNCVKNSQNDDRSVD